MDAAYGRVQHLSICLPSRKQQHSCLKSIRSQLLLPSLSYLPKSSSGITGVLWSVTGSNGQCLRLRPGPSMGLSFRIFYYKNTWSGVYPHIQDGLHASDSLRKWDIISRKLEFEGRFGQSSQIRPKYDNYAFSSATCSAKKQLHG
jgi:hypothetical protein